MPWAGQQEEVTALGACPVSPTPWKPPVHLLHLTAHPVRGVCSPEPPAAWQCSTSLLQEAFPALLRHTSHCQITQIAPFTPKEWDKCPFPPLKAPTATFPLGDASQCHSQKCHFQKSGCCHLLFLLFKLFLDTTFSPWHYLSLPTRLSLPPVAMLDSFCPL